MSTSPPEARARRGVRAAFHNLGWLLVGRGMQAALSLVFLAIATRTLGVTDFGRFALITGAAQALVTFVAFPTWQIVIQYGVPHLLAGDDAALGRLLRACGLLDLGSAIIGAAISVTVIALFAPALGLGPDLVGPVQLFAIVQLLALRSTPLGIMRLRDRYSRATWADSTTSFVRAGGAILAWWLMPTVAAFLLIWALAEVATSLAFWLTAARDGDVARMFRARVPRVVMLRENPGFFRFAVTSNANVTLGQSDKQLPILMVGSFVSPAAAGAFRIAFQIARALSNLAQVLTRAAFPELVRTVRKAKPGKLARLLTRLFLASSAAAVPILLLVVATGGKLLTLVGGEAYAGAYPILLWLAAGGCIDLATVAFEPVLMAMQRSGTAFAARSVATAFLVGAMLLLTPLHGAVGAAMAVALGSLVTAIVLATVTLRAVRAVPAPVA